MRGAHNYNTAKDVFSKRYALVRAHHHRRRFGFSRPRVAHTTSRDGHTVAVLTRRRGTPGEKIAWNPDGGAGAWAGALEGADAIVNLAGEGIADRRWNDARKRRSATAGCCPRAACRRHRAGRRRRPRSSSVGRRRLLRPVRRRGRHRICTAGFRFSVAASVSSGSARPNRHQRDTGRAAPDGAGAASGRWRAWQDAPAVSSSAPAGRWVRALSTCRGSISMIGFDLSRGWSRRAAHAAHSMAPRRRRSPIASSRARSAARSSAGDRSRAGVCSAHAGGRIRRFAADRPTRCPRARGGAGIPFRFPELERALHDLL